MTAILSRLHDPLRTALSNYVSRPSDDLFGEVLRLAESDSGSNLADVFYSLVSSSQPDSRVCYHNMYVLAIESRLVEAEWAIRSWLKSHAVDPSLARMAIEISVEAGHYSCAVQQLREWTELLSDSTRETLRGIFLLRFGNNHELHEIGRNLLTLKPRDKMALMVALQIALRLEDSTLACETLFEFEALKNIPTLGGAQQRQLEILLRRNLLALLRRRCVG